MCVRWPHERNAPSPREAIAPGCAPIRALLLHLVGRRVLHECYSRGRRSAFRWRAQLWLRRRPRWYGPLFGSCSPAPARQQQPLARHRAADTWRERRRRTHRNRPCQTSVVSFPSGVFHHIDGTTLGCARCVEGSAAGRSTARNRARGQRAFPPPGTKLPERMARLHSPQVGVSKTAVRVLVAGLGVSSRRWSGSPPSRLMWAPLVRRTRLSTKRRQGGPSSGSPRGAQPICEHADEQELAPPLPLVRARGPQAF